MDYTGGCDKETKMQLWSTWIFLAAWSHHRLKSVVVVVDISSMSVRTRVTRADGGIFIIVVLTTLVSGASVVHPVRQVGLQPLVRKQNPRHGRDSLGNSTNLKLIDTEAADKVSTETISCRDAWKGKCWKGQCFHSKWHPNPAGWNEKAVGCQKQWRERVILCTLLPFYLLLWSAPSIPDHPWWIVHHSQWPEGKLRRSLQVRLYLCVMEGTAVFTSLFVLIHSAGWHQSEDNCAFRKDHLLDQTSGYFILDSTFPLKNLPYKAYSSRVLYFLIVCGSYLSFLRHLSFNQVQRTWQSTFSK